MSSIISDADLRAMEKGAHQNKGDQKHFDWIKRTARIVRNPRLLKRVVRLNSLVLLWHSVLKRTVKFRIVLPHKADLKSRSLSVFAPISMAVIGKMENDTVRMRIGGIDKELKVLKVINRWSNK